MTAKQTTRAVAASVGVVALTAGLLTLNLSTVPNVPTITLLWDNLTNEPPGSYVTEVWVSTNLTDWQWRADVPTNRVTFPRDKPAEFFKVRNRGTNGVLSDWSRKTTR